MHTTQNLIESSFAITVDGREAGIQDVFPGFDTRDRLGVVVRSPCGATGASALIEAFESLSDVLMLEELAVPEDLDDPYGEVDLRVVGAEVENIDEGQIIVVRGTASLLTRAVAELGTGELTRLLRDDLLNSESLKEARVTVRTASAASRTTGIPDGTEAERN